MELGEVYTRPALSLTAQPALRKLFEVVCAENPAPLTIVCGAGVSMDSGFPSWATLIDRMCESAHPGEVQDLLRRDPIDLMRKADLIFQLRDQRESQNTIIRKALYKDFPPERPPGPLATAIARVCAGLKGPVRLATTNFDGQLEAALRNFYGVNSQVEDAVQSLGIDRVVDWLSLDSDPERAAVLHLHGMTAPRQASIPPILLTETDFRKHGPAVRDVVIEILRSSNVLFVGVSMTDPNVIGPLTDLKSTNRSGKEAFMLTVPPAVAGHEYSHCYDYSTLAAAGLERTLGLNVAVLKSYTQVQQVMYDLVLAADDHDRYFHRDVEHAMRYGHRLRRCLDKAYGAISKEPGIDGPDGQIDYATLSDRLHSVLTGEVLDGTGLSVEEVSSAPQAFLRSKIKKYARRAKRLRLTEDFFAGERFGLFLWLRKKVDIEGYENEYSIELVGTSVYSHRQPWSFGRVQRIEPGTGFPPVDSAFRGQTRNVNLDDQRTNSIWRAHMCVPLVVVNPDNELDVLNVGVVSLQSTRRYADSLEGLQSLADAGQDVAYAASPSILSFLDPAEQDELNQLVHRAALRAVFGR